MDTMASKLWIAAALGIVAPVFPARAQEPKVGDYYEDKTDLGFKVRVPQKWDPIPASPDDGNLIIKYDPKTNKVIQIGKEERMDLHVWILKFDRRKSSAAEAPAAGPKKRVVREKDFPEWLSHSGLKGFKPGTAKDMEINKVAATECVYTNNTLSKDNEEVRFYAMTYKLQPEVDVVFAGWGPGDPKRWSKFESAFKEMARSFKTVEVKAGKPELTANASLRDKKRAELQDAITRQPKWKLYETPNYFIVSDNEDKAFIDELLGRLEAIRAVYEQDYPAEKAKEIREAAARLHTGPVQAGKSGEGGAEGEPKSEPEDESAKPESNPTTKPAPVDSTEASRCSVVRVCKNADEYHSFGGPSVAAGHWSSNTEELVIYDDRASGGKGDTWITLNHEAFHQYIYYFYGNIAPHSWYNEGTGDFYSGYIYKNGRFTLEKNPWRKETIKDAIQREKFVPLTDLMRWDQRQYYGQNSLNAGGAQNYAEGWSLIYFLRTGKKNNAKGWNPKWDNILEDYLRVLAATGKPEQAIEQCLTGIDINALQAAWIEYTKP
jgi:hypothetical protein